MTLAKCKENFLDLLADAENRVIALSGKWGSGKSHLWREVQATAMDDQVKGSIYVSLFGLASVSELKLKIAQGALGELKKGSALAEEIARNYQRVKGALNSFSSRFSVLDELALLAAPSVLKDRFVVIDDVERKHEKLTIDEILGFIDDCVQSLRCRVLLILNSDQLGDKRLWELFREKVIDQELRLDTSPGEAFDIASAMTSTPWAANIRAAVDACQISNIRVVRKIIRVVNRLLMGRGTLPADVLGRVVPSTTLLSAIHFKVLDDGPNFEFVLNLQSFKTRKIAATLSDAKETPKEPSTERWLLLLDKLGIRSTDEFERLVVDFLSSGMLDSAAIAHVVDRYALETRELSAKSKVEQFFEHCVWYPEFSDTELLVELETLVPDVGLIDVFSVTGLVERATQLSGNAELGRRLLDGWTVEFRRKQAAGEQGEGELDLTAYGRPLHPEIEKEVRALQARRQSTATILEVCKKVLNDSSWGDRETTVMRSVTPEDYKAAICSAPGGRDLKILLLQSVEFLKHRRTYDPHFGDAAQSFLEACRSIAEDDPTARRSQLIRDVFREAGVELKPVSIA